MFKRLCRFRPLAFHDGNHRVHQTGDKSREILTRDIVEIAEIELFLSQQSL